VIAVSGGCVLLATGARAQVLRVGTYKGIAGQFGSIQSAVDAARPGDWVLVGPGDYHERADHRSNRGPQPDTRPAGVVMSTPDVYLRGMNRNTVVVDGTKPGAPPCSARPSDQDFGPAGSGGSQLGRNGILIWKAADVWVQNLTTCNFLGGSGDAGNEIWWDGGAGSAKVGGYGFYGSYLNATTTFYGARATAAQYGIFSSNWSGGTWDQTYTSNFNDSGLYIGACSQVCNQTVNHARSEFNALGYSGSNSGGQIVIKNSEFDNNEDGFDTNSQNGDDPSPQNGACPNNGISPITHTHSCWVFMDNYVHDNNNPNVPSAGLASLGPVGTGMSVSGGRNDTIMNNRFERNGAWGVVIVPFPDSSGAPCRGGNNLGPPLNLCWFEEWGNALIGNKFSGNGFFGNPTNGDFAEFTLLGGPSNCFAGNARGTGGAVTSSPTGLQQSKSTCGAQAPGNANLPFFTQVGCDSQVSVAGLPFPCLPGTQYPRRTQIVMHPLPPGLPTMPNPCAGTPANPWCGGQVTTVKGCVAGTAHVPLSTALRERFVSVAVRVAGRPWHTYRASGRHAVVPVAIGATRGWTIVFFVEQIKVGRHAETIRFARRYRSC
jgi:hypothetical protein